MPGAPCEDPKTAIRTMDFSSKDRFLFVGGPMDGKRCHVEMTTHGPDNILYMREAPKMPAPSAPDSAMASSTAMIVSVKAA